MARNGGIKYFYKLNKRELAEKLNVSLPEPRKRKEPTNRRPVRVFSTDGTTTKYRSICMAARALGIYPSQMYVLIANGKVEYV